jgi:hypothetical protein
MSRCAAPSSAYIFPTVIRPIVVLLYLLCFLRWQPLEVWGAIHIASRLVCNNRRPQAFLSTAQRYRQTISSGKNRTRGQCLKVTGPL